MQRTARRGRHPGSALVAPFLAPLRWTPSVSPVTLEVGVPAPPRTVILVLVGVLVAVLVAALVGALVGLAVGLGVLVLVLVAPGVAEAVGAT